MDRRTEQTRSHILQTGRRVFLRRPAAHDQDEFLTLMRLSADLHRGLVAPPLTPNQYAEYIKRCRRLDFAAYFVCDGKSGAIVGYADLSQIYRGGFQSAYLGYAVGAPYSGQGYMTEGLDLVLRDGFRVLKLHRIEANIQPSNAASIAIVKRLGFRLEGYSPRYLKVCGQWRDHERWVILAEEWRRNR